MLGKNCFSERSDYICDNIMQCLLTSFMGVSVVWNSSSNHGREECITVSGADSV